MYNAYIDKCNGLRIIQNTKPGRGGIMLDLSNKCFRTETDVESEKLLRIAVAQGYKLPKGLKTLVGNRNFKFTGFPYKQVSFPEDIPEQDALLYSDIFGNENEAIQEILKRSASFCRAYGYKALRVFADEQDSEYSTSAFAKTDNGGNIKAEFKLKKPRKITIEQIEQCLGFPIEIVP